MLKGCTACRPGPSPNPSPNLISNPNSSSTPNPNHRLPAAAAELSSQIVDVNDAFAKLKAGGDVTPKQLSTLLMTKSSALTTPQFTIPQVPS